VAALDAVSVAIAEGTFTAVTGPSGCGKSTLLHLLAALDRPDAGEIEVAGVRLDLASEQQRTKYRRETVGIVFQFFHLLPGMTLEENVSLPLLLAGAGSTEARRRAHELLGLAGLEGKMGRLPHEVSGGEMQRTAVARALVHRPRLLLADEPTGNLDSAGAGRVMDLLHRIHGDRHATILMVTHSESIAASLPARLRMADGRIVD
jgi:putative ABC transport system ATP-binding protein